MVPWCETKIKRCEVLQSEDTTTLSDNVPVTNNLNRSSLLTFIMKLFLNDGKPKVQLANKSQLPPVHPRQFRIE